MSTLFLTYILLLLGLQLAALHSYINVLFKTRCLSVNYYHECRLYER